MSSPPQLGEMKQWVIIWIRWRGCRIKWVKGGSYWQPFTPVLSPRIYTSIIHMSCTSNCARDVPFTYYAMIISPPKANTSNTGRKILEVYSMPCQPPISGQITSSSSALVAKHGTKMLNYHRQVKKSAWPKNITITYSHYMNIIQAMNSSAYISKGIFNYWYKCLHHEADLVDYQRVTNMVFQVLDAVKNQDATIEKCVTCYAYLV